MSYPSSTDTRPSLNLKRHGLVPSADPNRAGQLDWAGVYEVAPGKEFTIYIPSRDPTPDQVDQAIRQDYEKQKAFINRKIYV